MNYHSTHQVPGKIQKGMGTACFEPLILGTEDFHQQVRLTLIDYTTRNPEVFANFCSPLCTLEEHIARMRYETVWRTDLEIRVATTYFQLPIYICIQRSSTLTYH